MEVWGRRTRVWLPALLFVMANLVLLGAHRLVLLVRVGVQTQALERAEERLGESRLERQRVEDALELAHRTERDVEMIREERLATQAERLTRMMLRVKDLVRRAQLSGPSNIRYGDTPIEDLGLVKKEIQFSVSGSYEQVRRLINLIEISDSFLILEEIGVDESGGGELRIGVKLSTYFLADESGPPAT